VWGESMPDYQRWSDVAKALAHPLRLELVDTLSRQQEICVCELADLLGQRQANVSKHLTVLREAGIVSNRRAGLKIFYRLQARCAVEFLHCFDRMPLQGKEVVRR